MKKNIILSVVSAVLVLVASCQKTAVNSIKGDGYLSFSGFSLGIDEEVITKASPADGKYSVFVYNADNEMVLSKTYADVKNNSNKLTIPAGDYTLVVRSTESEVPTAEFEQPVYGVTHNFTITAGETEEIGELTCTLLQCKVTVSYSDSFLETVTGAGSTKVELTAGYPLEYSLSQDGIYDQSAGYFAVNGNTMTVTFKGSIDGKSMTMTKTFTGIAARQWRQIKFVNKTNEQGTASFDIVINDLVSDETLNNGLLAEEVIIGVDPNAPQDDGGIKLLLADNCDENITYTEENIVNDADGNRINSTGVIYIPIEPMPAGAQGPTMAINFNAVIPAGLAELTVDISTDSQNFAGAVATANATHIDLVNPVCDPLIFAIVPFPHGSEILGATSIDFDLSNAQAAIAGFKGTHLFTMTIVDVNGKTKVNKITMYVE